MCVCILFHDLYAMFISCACVFACVWILCARVCMIETCDSARVLYDCAFAFPCYIYVYFVLCLHDVHHFFDACHVQTIFHVFVF